VDGKDLTSWRSREDCRLKNFKTFFLRLQRSIYFSSGMTYRRKGVQQYRFRRPRGWILGYQYRDKYTIWGLRSRKTSI